MHLQKRKRIWGQTSLVKHINKAARCGRKDRQKEGCFFCKRNVLANQGKNILSQLLYTFAASFWSFLDRYL